MQFLKTLFWVLAAVMLALFASHNWSDVTLNLWGDIRADIKLPLLLTAAFLLGFLPPFLTLRGKLWRLRRRVESQARPVDAPLAAADAPPRMDEPAE